MTCNQELGHVERVDSGWRWATRMIPNHDGPLGTFAEGVVPTELAARLEVERRWTPQETQCPNSTD